MKHYSYHFRLLDIVTSFMADGKPKMRDLKQNYWPPMQRNGSKFTVKPHTNILTSLNFNYA